MICEYMYGTSLDDINVSWYAIYVKYMLEKWNYVTYFRNPTKRKYDGENKISIWRVIVDYVKVIAGTLLRSLDIVNMVICEGEMKFNEGFQDFRNPTEEFGHCKKNKVWFYCFLLIGGLFINIIVILVCLFVWGWGDGVAHAVLRLQSLIQIFGTRA